MKKGSVSKSSASGKSSRGFAWKKAFKQFKFKGSSNKSKNKSLASSTTNNVGGPGGDGSKKPVLRATPATILDYDRVKIKDQKKKKGFKMPKMGLKGAWKSISGSSTRSEKSAKRKKELQNIKAEEKDNVKKHAKENNKLSRLKSYKNVFIHQNALIHDDLQEMLKYSTDIMNTTYELLEKEKTNLFTPLENLDLDIERLLHLSDDTNRAIKEIMHSALDDVFEIIGDSTIENTLNGIVTVGKTNSFYRAPILSNELLLKYQKEDLAWLDEVSSRTKVSWGSITWLDAWFAESLRYFAIDLTIQREKFLRGQYSEQLWKDVLSRMLWRARKAIDARHANFVKCRNLAIAKEYLGGIYDHIKTNI